MSERNIHFVSLGCPKNRVDTEVMLGVAEGAGYAHSNEAEDADVIVVNTCGFIEAAKAESIETILELAELKKTGRCKKLIVAGCLSQRYPQELSEGMPEVDHFLGSSDMLQLKHALSGGERVLVGSPADWVMQATDPRRISTRGASAYLKIAEGCNRRCAFCVIPQLRGLQRSRPIEDLVAEAERLAAAGVLELNVISQDTIAYGRDLPNKPALAELVARLAEVRGIRWVRLFYLYPDRLSPPLIELLAQHPRVLPYIDMPLQHASDKMLRRMRRGHGRGRVEDTIESIRRAIPEATLRSAFIVGHPGETDEDFSTLKSFVEWAKLDRVGVFQYSDEPSAPAFHQDDKVDPELAAHRAEELMALQQGISRDKQRRLIGSDLEVLVEGASEESELVVVGRHRGQAPEIDGLVYLSGYAQPGTMVAATVLEALDYDLHAEAHEPDDIASAPSAAPAMPHTFERTDGRRILRVVQ